MTADVPWASRQSSFVRADVALAGISIVALLSAFAFVLTPGDALFSIDAGVKLVQAMALGASHFRSTALPYPGRAIDPDFTFFPFISPFVFLSAGEYQSIFPSPYPVLSALLLPAGLWAVRLIGIIATAAAGLAAAFLPGRRPSWPVTTLLVIGTPVWYLAIANGEMTLALAASTAAFAVALSSDDPRADLTAGICLGTAAIVRDEALLLAPGLLAARWLVARRAAGLAKSVVAMALPIVAMAALDWAWLDRPPLAHLRHAAPMLNAILPRSHAVLPELERLAWIDRYQTIVSFWLVGGGWMVEMTLVVGVLAAFAFRRRLAGPCIVAVFLILATVAELRSLVQLLPAPRSEAGLLRLAPFLVFALLPVAPMAASTTLRKVTALTTAAFLIATALSLTTVGGKGLGARLTAVIWPLLVASAWQGFASWRRWTGHAALGRTITATGALLVVCSITMEMGVALPAWISYHRQDVDALAVVRQSPDEVIVMDDAVNVQVIAPEYLRRTIFLVVRGQDWSHLADTLARGGIRRFTLLAREPRPDLPVAPFARLTAWQEPRYWVARYAR